MDSRKKVISNVKDGVYKGHSEVVNPYDKREKNIIKKIKDIGTPKLFLHLILKGFISERLSIF